MVFAQNGVVQRPSAPLKPLCSENASRTKGGYKAEVQRKRRVRIEGLIKMVMSSRFRADLDEESLTEPDALNGISAMRGY